MKMNLMKKKLILIILLLALSCNNDDDNSQSNPVNQLPPATNTGAQTFGCLINGEVFIPPTFGNNSPSAFYQFVDGAYTLGISARTGGGTELKSINIGCLDMPLIEEIDYTLLEFETENYFAEYRIGAGFVLEGSSSIANPGILTITNFDQENFIISGTFEFVVLDNDGNEINITNGRFDMNYTN
jgi:hypothetical protein